MNIDTIIFDFGGVLVDWNPRYVFKKYFDNEEEMEWFLANICTNEWNMEQDRGRSFAEATKILQNQFPEHSEMIAKFYGEWEDMLKSDIPGTVEILKELHQKYPLYGLTNWSAESIDIAYNRYDFFSLFKGIVVSGEEKLIKPEPEIYQVLLNRYNLIPEKCLFIDDNLDNVKAAQAQGINAIQFTTPEKLRKDLEDLNLL
ncbi:HAD family hydrolase [Ornithobacterium rhinotracheale]|uniref:HAD family hydrolase n=1 Tax=Ornithobacterium rhinotracheale TaxID=28251 RepID=UPI00403647BC